MDLFDLLITPAAAPSPAERAQTLRRSLDAASDAYYNRGDSPLSDEQFDAMMAELRALEAEHPEIRTLTSPSQRVGAAVPAGAKVKHRHMTPMLSLDNAMSDEDVRAFEAKAQRFLGRAVVLAPYTVELKMDGMSLNLTYEDGRLIRATTRGDGQIGEDVTANLARLVAFIPGLLQAPQVSLSGTIEVRGEVVMPRAAFDRLNLALEAEGREPYTNPRNTVAGLLRTEGTLPEAARGTLQFHAYDLKAGPGVRVPTESHSGVLDLLERWGFATSPKRLLTPSLEAAIEFTHDIFDERANLPFDIDGAVIKVDSLALQRELGTADRYPRWAIARKEKGETAITQLLTIDYGLGRTGAVTPRAVLATVRCGGVDVTYATLHNEEEIARLGLMIGDWVEIERRGDVIPKVLRALPERRDGTQSPASFPIDCPSCHGPIARPIAAIKPAKDGGPDLITLEARHYCDNPACPAQIVRRLEHFASRSALEIRGLGIKVAETLAASGLVHNVADLYDLRVEDVQRLDGFAPVSAQNLIDAIQASTQKPFDRVLRALGIRHVGETASEIFARTFLNIEALLAADLDELAAPDGIGPVIARTWHEWAQQESNREILRRLANAGLQMQAAHEAPVVAPSDSRFAGKTVVVTGKIEGFSRPDIEAMLKRAGAKVGSGISGSTDYLIAGEKAGSKLAKAQKAGVAVLTWDEARPLLGSL